MKLDWSSRITRILSVLLAALTLWARAEAIRFDWTADEIQCAQSLGIDLAADAVPGSYDYVKRLTWLADLVVTATVAEIRHDIRGAYHTQVKLNVLSTKKGVLPTGQLTVALISGPVYVAATDEVLEARAVNEPSFEKGETVLLFLTKGHIETPSTLGPSYDLPENFYSVVNGSKFKINGGVATLSGWGSGGYNLMSCNLQINLVVQAQSTNCIDEIQE